MVKAQTMRINRIKKHFEEEAEEYDLIIQKLIPYYNQMIGALVSIIPFSRESVFSTIDLGCGTGTISKFIKNEFSLTKITCVDISKNMLELAKNKIGSDVNCIQADLNSFNFPQKYDLIVSSLALHHLENDAAKLEFYRKICEALNQNGLFINIDVVLGSNDFVQDVYMKKWREFLQKNVAPEEIDGKWLPSYYAEDRPAKLITHLDMLRECGLSRVDVVYKYYNFAVYSAQK
jgi:tRNA (cmo5U34)-methyltransferase